MLHANDYSLMSVNELTEKLDEAKKMEKVIEDKIEYVYIHRNISHAYSAQFNTRICDGN